MSLLPIDKGVPIPERYPFSQMEVGDSFVLPSNRTRQAVTIAAKRYGDKHGLKFTIRAAGEGVLRCWRVK